MKYVIDPLHSDIEFKIKHLMISNVRGRFTSFRASMESSERDFSDASIECEIDVQSIYTGITDRDNHLRSPDFFDIEQYPHIRFKSTGLEKKGEEYVIFGDFTIRDVTKPITLRGTYNGNDEDAYGQTKYGFELIGKIKRSDWALDFNMLGGRNTLMIGDDVILDISIQMVEDV